MSNRICVLDAAGLRAFFHGGCCRLGQRQEEVNALNVFPVPDGDTGVNMYLTVAAGEKKLSDAAELGQLAADFARGTLMGARGNSGVILSQMFRGLSVAMQNQTQADAALLALAWQRGVDMAYKSVMKPVEGTILTVARRFAQACAEAGDSSDDIGAMLAAGLIAARRALADTPRLLPVLREAGVVDAGGQGLLLFLEGGYDALTGAETAFSITAPSAQSLQQPAAKSSGKAARPAAAAAPAPAAAAPKSTAASQPTSQPASQPAATVAAATPAAAREDISTAAIEFTYCTQLLISGHDIPVEQIRQRLSHTPPGDSLLVVGDESLVKIHFHNNEPAQVLAYCSQFGAIHDIIVDDMREQHHDNIAAAQAAVDNVDNSNHIDHIDQIDHIDDIDDDLDAIENNCFAAADDAPLCGVVAVVAGAGMGDIFSKLGACVVNGGQTMNPCAEDILLAVEQCPAQQVVVLPNNKNIVMAAEQAVSLASKPVAVVKSKYVTQGLAALLGFDPTLTAADNLEQMTAEYADTRNGELTYAVRDTKFNGFDIKEGDLLAISEGEIIGCCQQLPQVLQQLVEHLLSDKPEAELVSLYYGNDLDDAQAADLADAVQRQWPELEVQCYYGGQPLYYFLVAID